MRKYKQCVRLRLKYCALQRLCKRRHGPEEEHLRQDDGGTVPQGDHHHGGDGEGKDVVQAEIVRKTGKNLLSDPLFNKGLGFPRTERDRLGIRGLVPPSTYVIKIFSRNIENISFKI